MRLTICAVGRLRAGPEAALVADFLGRFGKIAPSLGLSPVRLIEIESRKGAGPEAEAALLRKALPSRGICVCLDERGVAETSPAFSARLARWRTDAQPDLAFVIGGAEGIAPQLRAGADHSLSLGPMVWPHMLVRVMLAEQLYRAATILIEHPYHKA